MILEPFPGCCGVYVLSNLHEGGWPGGREDISGLGGISEVFSVERATHVAHQHRRGLVLATTSGYQRREAKVLRRANWKRIGSFRNPNSGNRVSLWLKTLPHSQWRRP